MKDEEIKKPISRTELTPYSRGFADGEEFGVSKAKSQTIQQVRDVLETKLNYWNNLLKNKSNHSLSDEIDIQQMRAKVEIIEELLSQLDDVSLNNEKVSQEKVEIKSNRNGVATIPTPDTFTQRESYVCGECGFYTENLNQMNEHMKEHKKEIKGEVKNG